MTSFSDALSIYADYADKLFPKLSAIIEKEAEIEKGMGGLFKKLRINDALHSYTTLLNYTHALWRKLYTNENEWVKVQLSGQPYIDFDDNPFFHQMENLFLYTDYLITSKIDNLNGKGLKPNSVEMAEGIVEIMDIIENAVETLDKE